MAADTNEQHVEVVSRFDELEDCAGLLYAPLDLSLKYRKTRCYRFVYSGDGDALEAFVRKTLLDPVSQELSTGSEPALEGFRFYLDYGMKKGVLDLEKEAILRYERELEDRGFEIQELELATRIYVFGDDGDNQVSAPFVRDIVNPAIHRWSIHDDRSCA